MSPRYNAGKTRRSSVWGLIIIAGLALCALVAVLRAIGAEGVSAGGDQFVTLPASDGALVQPRPTATPTVVNSESGRRFAEGLAVVPRDQGIAGSGFVITPQSIPEMLAVHRLRVGDVLLTMDGKPIDPARVERLGDELATFDAVEVSYERAGQVRNRLLTFD